MNCFPQAASTCQILWADGPRIQRLRPKKTSSGLPWEPWEVKDLGPLKQRPKTALRLYRHKICGIYRYILVYIFIHIIYIYTYVYIYIYIWKSIIGFNTSSPKLSNLVFFPKQTAVGGPRRCLSRKWSMWWKWMVFTGGIFHHHPWKSLKHLPITRKIQLMPFIPKFNKSKSDPIYALIYSIYEVHNNHIHLFLSELFFLPISSKRDEPERSQIIPWTEFVFFLRLSHTQVFFSRVCNGDLSGEKSFVHINTYLYILVYIYI